MPVNGNRIPLAVAVPVHNEERRLPRLIGCLRAQSAAGVPVVFVDNGSSDGSGALLRACREVARGQWFCIDEPRVGKANAMAAATAYCAGELGARNVCFLDADSQCVDARWIETSASLAASDERLGFVYSPMVYTGLECAPVLAAANRARDLVIERITGAAVSFANAGAATYSADLLGRFLGEAEPGAEQGLRLSLLALSERRRGHLNRGVVLTSGRRITSSAQNLRRWCFYERDFYRLKDINDAVKLDLDSPREKPDLEPCEIELFFERQALKVATRNLAALAVFDSTGTVAARIADVFSVSLDALVEEMRPRLDAQCVFGSGLDELLQSIARFASTVALARRLEHLFGEEHRSHAEDALNSDTPR